MRLILAALAIVSLAACATATDVRKAANVAPLTQSREILLVQPDIQLSVQTMAGLEEPRADWSSAAQKHIAAALASWTTNKGHTVEAFDPTAHSDGRIGQLIRLNAAVGQSILLFNYSGYPLPTKTGVFDWTLGPGVREIRAVSGSRYALFIIARGSYADSGRVAAAVGLALLGVVTPLGGQYMMASLVDLDSGQVVWFNVASAGANDDMRDPQGAERLMRAVLVDAPL